MGSEPDVLYLEDEDNDVLLLRRAMARAGLRCNLVAMEDTSKAIEYLQRLGPERADGVPRLVLIDVKLIGSTGFEFLEWLREWRGREKVRVIVLSSSSAPDQVSRAQALGADAYLEKPNDFDDLVAICQSFRPVLSTESPANLQGPAG